ncbi:MAG TPA: hypothetical protein VHB98_10920 [Chloroflexota bacterium]|nr:hypothetical protein [Chloroflexota bacterium]
MATTDQNAQAQQPLPQTQAQTNRPQGGNGQQPAAQGPVAPSSDMYDPRLLVDVIKSGQPDITRHIIRPPEQK